MAQSKGRNTTAGAKKTTAGNKTAAAKKTSAGSKTNAGKKTAAGNRSSSAAKKSGGSKKTAPPDFRLRGDILFLVGLTLCVLLFISILGFGGVLGKAVSSVSFGLFGLLAYLLPFLLFYCFRFSVFPMPIHGTA